MCSSPLVQHVLSRSTAPNPYRDFPPFQAPIARPDPADPVVSFTPMRTPKAVPIVLRQGPSGSEVLLFIHPLAGVQLVKGTVEPGESVNEAAIRELAEESGIEGASCASDLGAWEQGPPGPSLALQNDATACCHTARTVESSHERRWWAPL